MDVSSGLSGLVSLRGVFLCEGTFSSGGRGRVDGFNIMAASDQLLGCSERLYAFMRAGLSRIELHLPQDGGLQSQEWRHLFVMCEMYCM